MGNNVVNGYLGFIFNLFQAVPTNGFVSLYNVTTKPFHRSSSIRRSWHITSLSKFLYIFKKEGIVTIIKKIYWFIRKCNLTCFPPVCNFFIGHFNVSKSCFYRYLLSAYIHTHSYIEPILPLRTYQMLSQLNRLLTIIDRSYMLTPADQVNGSFASLRITPHTGFSDPSDLKSPKPFQSLSS
jgi:hypothetical protein